MKYPKINSVIICDDIRTEVSGKLILIGIYSDYIVVPNFPLALRLSFRFSGKRGDVDSLVFEVEAYLKDTKTGEKTKLAGTKLAGEPELAIYGVKSDSFSFALSNLTIPVEAASILIIKARAEGQRFYEVIKTPIVLRPNSSTVQQQPS